MLNKSLKNSDKIKETRSRLITKLLPYLRKNGLQSVRMDEIARVTEVSRATLYKYFSTKEEIIGYIVEGFVEYMNEQTASSSLESEESFGIRFQQMFEQSVSLIVYFTEVFLKDLETSYPEWHSRFTEGMQQREEQILAYYQEGIRRGLFHDLNGKILIMQDELLRGMLNVKYLMTNQLTVEQVLTDYYQLKKIQLFKADKLSAIDDALMKPRIEHLTHKVTGSLF
ncbi:TetR/AcrR family transcriptional regulator [Paenibacillus sp. FSL R7-0273]|uniref:TetR/AcrR family transcriptional regulator n=1 Tax=Paenibacillus sp. FSL R7-0273 TaxID=1536772 RepID=UPI000AB324A3|nr:TetR/AcrR family transcriptional regulator [Paenibacillus sp. FSL R7-0273]